MDTHRLPWTTILLLSVLALVRPLFNLTGGAEDWGERGEAPPEVFAAVSLVWIVVGVFTARPLETLAAAGVTYAMLEAVLVTGLSPVLTNDVQGPLADPLALLDSVTGNVLWGAVCGLVAQGLILLQRRGARFRARRRGGGHDGPPGTGPPDGPDPSPPAP